MNSASPVENWAQSFEWIQHGDAGARKRARAHVTRGFRREKAAAQAKKEQEEKVRRNGSSQSSSSPPQDDVLKVPGSSRTTPITPPHTTLFQPYEPTMQGVGGEPVDALNQWLLLQRTPGTGRTDPFSTLSVQVAPGTHALLDHGQYA